MTSSATWSTERGRGGGEGRRWRRSREVEDGGEERREEDEETVMQTRAMSTVKMIT